MDDQSGERILEDITKLQPGMREWLQTRCRGFIRPHEIDDVIQEACVKMLKKDLRTVKSPLNYIHRVLQNAARDWFRRERVRLIEYVADPEMMETEGEASPERAAIAMQQLSAVSNTLSVERFNLLVARHVHGLTIEEVSEMFKMSQWFVRSEVSKAMAQIQPIRSADKTRRR